MHTKHHIISKMAFFASLTLALCLVAATVVMAYTKTLTVAKPVGGVVTGTGIACGLDCSEEVEDGTTVTLTAAADAGRQFAYWQPAGICAGHSNQVLESPVCHATIGSSASGNYVKAHFVYTNYTVEVIKEGSGSGTVSGAAGPFGYNATVNLTASPASGSVFAGWQTSGDRCYIGSKGGSGVSTSPSCSFTTSFETESSNNIRVVARFDKIAAQTKPTAPSTTTPPPSSTPAPNDTSQPLPISEFKVNNEQLPTTPTDKPVIAQNQIVLSGKTTPLATVNLYIHSEPRQVSVKADEQGNWATTVTDLENGDHRVEAEVVDPSTGKTSERKELAAFTVNAPLVLEQSGKSDANMSILWIAIPAALAVIAAGVSGWWFWQHHKKPPKNNLQPPISPTPPIVPPVEPPATN